MPSIGINALTAMILVNTIFFNGTWEKKFETFQINHQIFHHGEANSQVEMMNDDRTLRIKRNVLGADVAELPFVGGRFSLYIALPHDVNGITSFESSLAVPANVNQLFEGLSFTRVRLSIPKFKIESTLQLNSALAALGMVKPFDPQTANFQGISSAGNLYISNVIHKAVIEVTEIGTVAAAVTAVGIPGNAISQPPTEVFKADHPFIFFLRDNLSQEILFQGKFSG